MQKAFNKCHWDSESLAWTDDNIVAVDVWPENIEPSAIGQAGKMSERPGAVSALRISGVQSLIKLLQEPRGQRGCFRHL